MSPWDEEALRVFINLSRAAGMKPPTDESLEDYCRRKYEEHDRDPQCQMEQALVDSCTDENDIVDVEKLQRILDGKEPFGH